MYLAQSQVKCGSCRVRVQKSKLSYRHSEPGAVKVKQTRNVQACSLFFFIFFALREVKKKNSFLFFPFYCNNSPISLFPPNNGGREIRHSCLAEDKLQFCSVWKSPAVQPRDHLSLTSNFPRDMNSKKSLLGWWGTDGQSSITSLMLTQNS